MATKPATKTVIAIGRIRQQSPLHLAAVALRHPLNGCPAVAEPTGFYRQNGRVVGLVLQFADGHTASLTFDEIRELQATPEGA